MAIETGTQVKLVNTSPWKSWGWLNNGEQIVKVLLVPDRIYTVTIASSRFKRDDGTYQSVTKMTCPVSGLEVMAPRDSIAEHVDVP